MAASLLLAACASAPEDDRFQVGQEATALVIVGVAKSARDTSPRYAMLWRRLDESGRFAALNDRASFEARTNQNDSVRVRGIPGEFAVVEVEPGAYALDGVFAAVPVGRVNYVAQGVIAGPERPAFEVGAGEAVYLGIWELDIEETSAVARLWRLSAEDARAVERVAGSVNGRIALRNTHTRAVPCSPHEASAMTTRRVC